METKAYTTWLNNEYTLWQNALKDAPFHKFKHHPAVIRMIGLTDLHREFIPLIQHLDLPWQQLEAIDQIGSPQHTVNINGVKLSGVCLRFIYYAHQVLDTIEKYEQKRLVEIGGGYGGFCAIIHALAIHRKIQIDNYIIYDLPEVQEFQIKYIRQTFEYIGVSHKEVIFPYCFKPHLFERNSDFAMSFYALGEFDTPTKNDYIENIIAKVPRGLILWNPHSGSDSSLDLLRRYHPTINVKPEHPLTSPNNQEVTW